MTVYSINQRVFEQSNISTPSGKSAEDQSQDFTDALMQARNNFGAVSNSGQVPATETVISNRLDRAQDDVRAATKPQEKADKAPDRKNDAPDRKAKAADKSDRGDDKADKTQNAGKVEDDQAQDDMSDAQAVAEAPAEQVEATQLTQTQQAAAEAQVVAVAQIAPTQVAQAVKVEAKVQKQDQGGQKTIEIGDETQVQTGPQIQVAQKGQVFDATRDQGFGQDDKAAKTKDGTVQQLEETSLLDTQASDLALSIDDTGANIKVAVSVTGPVQPMATSVTQSVAVTAQDIIGEDPALQAGPQAGNKISLAPAQPQVQAQSAQQPQAEVADATPFAAIIAAQLEASNDVQAPGQQAQSGPQAIGALGSTSAAQAAQKNAAAQAPRPAAKLADPKEVADQVNVEIAKQAKDGNDTITVSLKPVELGKIEIKLELGQDGKVNATITADRQETLDVLKADQKNLAKALQNAGLDADNGQMTFNLRGEGQNQSAQNGGQNSRQRRSKLTVAAEIDAASAQAAQASQARLFGRSSGVDVSV